MSRRKTLATVSNREASEKSKSSSFKNQKLKRLACSPKTQKESRKVSNFTQTDGKDDCTQKLIYTVDQKTNDSKKSKVDEIDFYLFTFKVIFFVRVALIIFLTLALIFQTIFGESLEWIRFGEVLLWETLPTIWLVQMMIPLRRGGSMARSMSKSTLLLVLEYSILVVQFSSYLQIEESSGRSSSSSIFHHVFSLSTVTMASTIAHFFLIIQSIELISESRKIAEDFSDQIIVEGLEKQTIDLNSMKRALVEEIFREDQNSQIYLTITDKEGNAKSLHGTDLGAEVTRKFEFLTDGKTLQLSRDIMTKASVETSKIQKAKNEKASEDSGVPKSNDVLAPNSKYNDCLKAIEDRLMTPNSKASQLKRD